MTSSAPTARWTYILAVCASAFPKKSMLSRSQRSAAWDIGWRWLHEMENQSTVVGCCLVCLRIDFREQHDCIGFFHNCLPLHDHESTSFHGSGASHQLAARTIPNRYACWRGRKSGTIQRLDPRNERVRTNHRSVREIG